MKEPFLSSSSFFSRRDFKQAKKLLDGVKLSFSTPARNYYEVDGEEVILDRDRMRFSCTCEKGSLFVNSFCSHVLAVIAWEVNRS